MTISKRKPNIRTIRKIENHGGMTFRHGHIVTYKSGWQVAFDGIQTTDINEAVRTLHQWSKMYKNVGLWFEDGVYYVDRGLRVSTKKQALDYGRKCNQISVYGWARDTLAYC